MPRSLPLLLVSGILVLTLGGGLAYVAHDAAASGATGLDAFADAVARGYGGDRVDAALSLADLEREPVELIAQGSRERFDRGQEAELAARARAALAGLDSPSAELIQRSVDRDGSQATVAVRLRTASGFINARFDLLRRGENWLMRRVVTSGS
ncbi:MAG: hypothetical protein KC543_07785 [Myxococcales bacterium]|nr:hypothetical protein [Myxococcales bacterium]